MATKKKCLVTVAEAQRDPDTGLTVAQERAAVMLAEGTPLAAVAKTLEVGRSTIYGWLKVTAFIAYHKRLLRDVRRQIRGRLSHLAGKAADTIEEIMDGGTEANRMAAAKYVLDRLADDDKLVQKAKNRRYAEEKK